MASGLYQAFKQSVQDRSIHSGVDIDTDTLKVLLVTADQAANLNTHQDRADITQEVANSGSYSAGGATLAGVTVTASSGTVTVDATDAAWTGVTWAAVRGSVVYKSSGTSTTDLLIAWHDHGAQAVTAANYTVQWNASGLWTLA